MDVFADGPVTDLDGLLADWAAEDSAPADADIAAAAGDHVPQWLLHEADVTFPRPQPQAALQRQRGSKNAEQRQLRALRTVLQSRLASAASLRDKVEASERLVIALSPLRRRLERVECQAIALAAELASPKHHSRVEEAERALVAPLRRLAACEKGCLDANGRLRAAEAKLADAKAHAAGLPRPGGAADAHAAVRAAENAVRALTQRELDEVRALLPTPPAAVRRALTVVWVMLHPAAAVVEAEPARLQADWRSVVGMLRRREDLLVALGDAGAELPLAEHPEVQAMLSRYMDGRGDGSAAAARNTRTPLRRLSASQLKQCVEQTAAAAAGELQPGLETELRCLSTLSLRQLASARCIDCQGTRAELLARLTDASRPPGPLTLEQVARASSPVAALYAWASAKLRLLQVCRGARSFIEADEAKARDLSEAEAKEQRARQDTDEARAAAAAAAEEAEGLRAEVARLRSALAELKQKPLRPPSSKRKKVEEPAALAVPAAAPTTFRGSWPLIGAMPA
eukprot:TRINITY_DN64_c1_g1_i1.p1 TRINITY_DN64_c1_g1~~TRINITY_DN64_c1_g1_i1.p1  ORF type:complete len:515 (+),score=177.78 TRINITY_DN64_c1_g1_i1:58-1602(+)